MVGFCEASGSDSGYDADRLTEIDEPNVGTSLDDTASWVTRGG